MIRVVLLPAIPASAITQPVELILGPSTLVELMHWVEILKRSAEANNDTLEIVSYIRHQPTMDILKKYIQHPIIQGDEYRLSIGDFIFVIGLKKRAPKGAADILVTEEDLVIVKATPRRI